SLDYGTKQNTASCTAGISAGKSSSISAFADSVSRRKASDFSASIAESTAVRDFAPADQESDADSEDEIQDDEYQSGHANGHSGANAEEAVIENAAFEWAGTAQYPSSNADAQAAATAEE